MATGELPTVDMTTLSDDNVMVILLADGDEVGTPEVLVSKIVVLSVAPVCGTPAVPRDVVEEAPINVPFEC
jgi:hypothetical protein